jgi:hypothetical protein
MDKSLAVSRRSSALRHCGAILLMAGFAACTTVGPVDSPGHYIATKQPHTVWLTKSNRSVVRVDGPRMLGDTVIGSVGGEYTEVPLSEVTRVAAMQSSKSKTIAAALLGGAVTAGALALIFSHSGSGPMCNPCVGDTLTLNVTGLGDR